MPAFALLDKSHLTWLTHEERTFHIFYQLSQNKVLHTLPDSFRNFKTPLSTNASHHGSWLNLQFNKHGWRGRGGIKSAKMPAFVPLNKSRLTGFTHEEHTFHIFYQFLTGAAPQECNHFTPEDWT